MGEAFLENATLFLATLAWIGRRRTPTFGHAGFVSFARCLGTAALT
jgi:hypothetical protein